MSVAALARGLAGGGPAAPVAAAGGALPGGGLGTSADLVVRAAREVDGGAGVAVLADLGSAVLTVKALLAEEDELPADAARGRAVRGGRGGGPGHGVGGRRPGRGGGRRRDAYRYRKE